MNRYFLFIQSTNNKGCYRYADMTVMSAFCKYMYMKNKMKKKQEKKIKKKQINK